jgi:hypothetical protein
MREVEWTDRHEYRHRALVRDTDPDSAAENGIQQDPPDLDLLDWEGIKRDIHNAMVERRVSTWESLQLCQCITYIVAQSGLGRRLKLLLKAQSEVRQNE